MVTPTGTQRFFADGWPIRIWFVVAPGAIIVVAVRAAEITPSVLLHWRPALWAAGVLIFAAPLGLLAAAVLAWFVLGPLYYHRELRNGGPFKVGDMVQIIGGRCRGHVGRVYSTWQGDTVRVDVGEEAREKFTDIFGGAELVHAEPASGTH